MSEEHERRTFEVRTIDGVDAHVNTDPGELFIDLPASNPRYIHVREGDRIQEGDVGTRSTGEMAGPLLAHWSIESITTETVTGTDTESGETRTWDREQLIRRLSGGEFSAELTSFARVSVTEIEPSLVDATGGAAAVNPYVIAIAYGNNGEKFTRLYAATEAGDWDSLEVVRQDTAIDQFGDDLRERFDHAVREALEVERRYH